MSPELVPLYRTCCDLVRLGARALIWEPLPLPLYDTLRQMARSNHSSMEALLCLVANGFGMDALRITRTMFETAVNAHYLDESQKDLEEFLEFYWLKRHKYEEYLKNHAPTLAYQDGSKEALKLDEKFKSWRARVGKRNEWCAKTFADRAALVKADIMSPMLFNLGSSFIHNDSFGLEFAKDEYNNVILGPSVRNLGLALSFGGVGYAMMLDVYQRVSGAKFEQNLALQWKAFKDASAILKVDIGPSPK